MKTVSFYAILVLLISGVLTSSIAFGHSLIMCTIQFPQSVPTVPTMRIYCGGRIIASSVDQKNKAITFNVPKYTQQFRFNLLITEKIDFAFSSSKYQSAPHNTASYIKLPDDQPYTFYNLLLAPQVGNKEYEL